MDRRFALMFVVPMALAVGCSRADTAVPPAEKTAAAATETTAATAEATATSTQTAAATGGEMACAHEGGACTGECGHFDKAATAVLDREVPADARWTKVTVTGMHCGGCERRIIANVGKLDGVLGVEADAELGLVRIAMAKDAPASVLASAREKLTALGYPIVDHAQ